MRFVYTRTGSINIYRLWQPSSIPTANPRPFLSPLRLDYRSSSHPFLEPNRWKARTSPRKGVSSSVCLLPVEILLHSLSYLWITTFLYVFCFVVFQEERRLRWLRPSSLKFFFFFFYHLMLICISYPETRVSHPGFF